METEVFTRDSIQNEMIGLSAECDSESIIKPLGSFNDASVSNINDEIVQFSTPCSNCQMTCETNMKLTGNCSLITMIQIATIIFLNLYMYFFLYI